MTTQENLSKHYFPLTNETYSKCGEGCNKPGLGHPDNDPSTNECGDCALLCCPCAFTIDILILPYKALRRLFRSCFRKRINAV